MMSSGLKAQSPPAVNGVQPDGTSLPNRLVVQSPQLEPTHSLDISTEVPGTLAKVNVSEGDTVKAGELIAQLRDASLRLRAEKAKVERDVAAAKAANDIDLRLASKSEAVASTEWRRAVEANRSVKDAVPMNEVDRLKLVLDRTTLKLNGPGQKRRCAN